MSAGPARAGAQIGPYELLSPLGAGGMGEVWKARDGRLGRIVAIKFSRAQFSERFEREARTIAALNHPNIAQVYDIGENYIVMEFVDGSALDALENTRRIVEVVSQVADGLTAAHEAGIVHRDLKPDNILLTKAGVPKIVDFGISKRTPTPRPDDRTETVAAGTDPGSVIGTAAWMSPEQVRGESVDHRSDLFSLGVILYELLAGCRPFQRSTSIETMHAILKEDAPELPEVVPASLRQVVTHALDKAPEKRFQSARDFAFALRVSATTTTATAVALQPATMNRRVLLGGAAALTGGLLSGIAGYHLHGIQNPRKTPSFAKLTYRDGFVRLARWTPNRGYAYSADWSGKAPGLYYVAPGEQDGREIPVPGLAKLLAVSARNEAAVLLRNERTLARLGLSGGAPRELLTGVTHADWSPDGESLAVLQSPINGKTTIQYPIGNVLGERPGIFATYDLRVSPSGDLVAYTGSTMSSGGFRGSGFEVAVLDRKGTKRVLASFVTQGHNFSNACWTPDGREVWFDSPFSNEAGVIYAVDLDGRRRIAATMPGRFAPQSIGPEGQVLLIQQRNGSNLKALSGGAERDLTWGESTAMPRVSADGSFCTFLVDEGKQVGYLRRLDGSGAVRLGDGGPVSISPDGKWVQLFRTTLNPASVLVPTGPGQEKPFVIDRFAAGTGEIVAWLPDEVYLVCGREEGKSRRLYLWSARTRELKPVGPDIAIRTYQAFADPKHEKVVAANADGRWMLHTFASGELKPLQLTRYQQVVGFTGDGHGVWVLTTPGAEDCVGCSLFVSAARIGKLDLGTLRLSDHCELHAPPGAVIDGESVRVTPDGKTCLFVHRKRSSDLYLARGLV